MTQTQLIYNIIAHPEQLVTLEEFEYFLPSLTPETIGAQLGYLVDKNAVARVETDEAVFYGLTAAYREELESGYVLRAERTLQETTMMTETTPEIEEKMNLDRPPWGPARPYSEADDVKRRPNARVIGLEELDNVGSGNEE